MLADLQIYFGVALAGLVSFLSPCVLPLVPPYLGYLGGTTIDEFTAEGGVPTHVWRRVVLASVLFVLGFTTVFVGLGAGASLFGQLIQTYKRELEIVAGLVIILFGLHFLGIFRIGLLYKEARYHGTHHHGVSYIGAYVIGLAFAFGWTPCIGPILATVLALAANEGSLDDRREALVRLLAGARHPVHSRGGSHRAVPRLHAALPPPPGRGGEGDGRAARRYRAVVLHRLDQLVRQLAAR